jgi:hypothetical protein
MPERRSLLRRIAYLSAVATTLATFAFAVMGIAGTQGHVRPDGRAAGLARQLDEQAHERCPFARPAPHAQREV